MTAQNPIHSDSPAGLHWTTTNVGEAIPGVITPLSWTMWNSVAAGLWEAGYTIGAFTRKERDEAASALSPLAIFFGRGAFMVEFFAMLGDRLPGTSGRDAAAGILGRIPEDIDYRPTVRRYPVIAVRLPTAFLTVPVRVRRAVQDWSGWYSRSIDVIPSLDERSATAKIVEARERLGRAGAMQTVAVFCVVQPLHDAVEALTRKYGIGDVASLSGAGGAEMRGVLSDIWRASRDELTVDDILARHGFNGPNEGEASAKVWREDPTPLLRRIAEFRELDETQSPLGREQTRLARGEAIRPQLLAAVPRWQRPLIRVLLSLAAKGLPLRGAAKVTMLQSVDVGRAAARRLGSLLVESGRLDDVDDVFFLTVDELQALPEQAKAIVAERRELYGQYKRMDLPSDWMGNPAPQASEAVAVDVITGIGVSAGVVEGRARVLFDTSGDVEPGEILIAPTTDPSWSSLMFVSAALVVDIGSILSHAAVIARELEIPCIVNTRDGTRQLRTGDLVRVDGTSGQVEVLERAVLA